MSWNIFKRIAELEATVSRLDTAHYRLANQSARRIDELEQAIVMLSKSIDNSNGVSVEQFPIITDFSRAVVRMEGAPVPMTEEERKRERLAQSKRDYYLRNRDKILARQQAKKRDEERKRKMREYAKKYYAKKKAEAKAKPVDQPRFIEAA